MEQWRLQGRRGWDGRWRFIRWRRGEARYRMRDIQVRLILLVVGLGVIDGLSGGAIHRLIQAI